MTVNHSGLLARTLAGNALGDSITIDPNTSDRGTICGIFSYETIDSTGVESRQPIMRIAACERRYVPHGTKVRLSSVRHGLDNVPAQVKGTEYSNSGTIALHLLANDG